MTPTPTADVRFGPTGLTSAVAAAGNGSAVEPAGTSGPVAARHAALGRLWHGALSPADQAWLERRLPRTAYVRIGRQK